MKTQILLIIALLILTISACGGGISESDAQATADAAVSAALAAQKPETKEVTRIVTKKETVLTEVTRIVTEREEVPVTVVVTAAPTPAPPPTSTPEPVTTLEIEASAAFETEFGTAYIIGVLRNTGNVPLNWIKIVASLYDADGAFVGTEYTYSEHDVAMPGQAASFSIGMMSPPEFSIYELQLEFEEAAASYLDRIVLDLEIGDSIDEWGSYTYHISGIVDNTGANDADFVKIVAAVYDTDGDLIAVDYAYSELELVKAGASSPFDISISDMVNKNTARYVLTVEGNRAD